MVNRRKIKAIEDVVTQAAATEVKKKSRGYKVREDGKTRFRCELDPADLKILIQHRYGFVDKLEEKFGIKVDPDILDKTGEVDDAIVLPPEIQELFNTPQRSQSGAINPQYYRDKISACTAKSIWMWEKFGIKVDVSAITKALIEEAKQFGVDLSTRETLDLFSWLDDKDLYKIKYEDFAKLIRQVRKVHSQNKEQLALKKKWCRLLVALARVQAFSRKNDMAAWTYIGRDQEKSDFFDWEWFHLKAGDMIMSGDHVMCIMPSGHGKTNLLMGLDLCNLGRNPWLRFCYVYNSQDVSKRIQYMRSWIDHPRYRAVYPNVLIDTNASDTKTSFSVLRDVPSVEPSVDGRSILQKSEGIHPDKIRFDDVHTRESAYSEAEREAVKNAFKNTWKKRLNPGGQFVIIGTRWHDNDMYGDIIALQNDSAHVNTTEERDIEVSIKILTVVVSHRIDDKGKKVPYGTLWPKRFSAAKLMDEFLADPVAFSRDRWGDPVEPGSQVISRLNFFNPGNAVKYQLLDRWISMDPAISTSKTADFSGISLISRVYLLPRMEPRAIVQDAWMIKKRPADIGKFLRERFESDQADYCLYESRGAFQSLLADVQEEMGPYADRLVRWPGLGIDKYERLKATSRTIQQFFMWPGHMADNLWVPQPRISWLCNHILRYPSIDHPDGLDSITQFAFHHRDFFLEGPQTNHTDTDQETPIQRIMNRLLGRKEDDEGMDDEMNCME